MLGGKWGGGAEYHPGRHRVFYLLGWLNSVVQLYSAQFSVRQWFVTGSTTNFLLDLGVRAAIFQLVFSSSVDRQWSVPGPVNTLVELGARTDGSDRRGRQLKRMSPSPLRTAELISVWRRSALVLPPWRRSSSQPPRAAPILPEQLPASPER